MHLLSNIRLHSHLYRLAAIGLFHGGRPAVSATNIQLGRYLCPIWHQLPCSRPVVEMCFIPTAAVYYRSGSLYLLPITPVPWPNQTNLFATWRQCVPTLPNNAQARILITGTSPRSLGRGVSTSWGSSQQLLYDCQYVVAVSGSYEHRSPGLVEPPSHSSGRHSDRSKR